MSNEARINQIKAFLEKTPDDAFLNYALATEYVAVGEDHRALQIFKELIHKQESYFATYYHLGKLYERMEDFDLAEATYEKGIEITKSLNERHAQRELQSAYDELTM
jgi:tetratricopeptide (TPR) repeat protein